MTQAEDLHRLLVDLLVGKGCLSSPAVERAFRAVSRAPFLANRPLQEVYSDESVVTRWGSSGLPLSSSTEPCLMATMLEQLGPRPGHRVLEIGAGTGYNAALLAHLVAIEGRVTTVDIDEAIVGEAHAGLARAGFEAVEVVHGDGWLGHARGAPYDRIEVTVGVWDISPHWVEQLERDALLLVPLWLRGGLQVSVAFERHGGVLRSVSTRPCGFMRLRGRYAGPEGYLQFQGGYASLDAGASEVQLGELLECSPRSVPAQAFTSLPPGWFPRFALDVPGAFLFVRDIDKRPSVGLCDPRDRSLALLDDDRIVAFGGEAARAALQAYLPRARPLNVNDLLIWALPLHQPAEDAGAWVLDRPGFRLLVRERARPPGPTPAQSPV